MNVKLIALVVIVAVIVLGGAYLLSQKTPSLGLGEFNNLQNPTITSTTTGSFASNVPVKVLDNRTGRKYARIINDGTTDVYLYISNDKLCYNFAEMDASCIASATSTITELTGIKLGPSSNAVSGDILYNSPNYYDITPDNQFTGEIWATSSAASVKIISIER